MTTKIDSRHWMDGGHFICDLAKANYQIACEAILATKRNDIILVEVKGRLQLYCVGKPVSLIEKYPLVCAFTGKTQGIDISDFWVEYNKRNTPV